MPGIISGISAFFQAIATALGMMQAKEQRDEGATAQNEATDAANIKLVESASAPVSPTLRDQLWNRNAQKFGADGKTPG